MAEHLAETSKKNWISYLFSAECRKLQVVVVGIVFAFASAGLLPASITEYVLVVEAVLISFGVYKVPNKKEEPKQNSHVVG